MTLLFRKQDIRTARVLTCAAITMLCISGSPAAWADMKNFDLAGFTGISAAEGIHVEVSSAEVFDVIAESDDPRQLEYLKLDVRGGALRAQMKDGLFAPKWVTGDKVTIRVSMPSFTAAEAFSGAEILADVMSGPDLKIASSGGSRLRVKAFNGGEVSVKLSGGGSVQMNGGTCSSLSANVSGGSSLDMEKVQCAEVEIDASSGSHGSFHADKLIKANAASGARIDVYGAHEEIEIDVSGGGEIEFP